MATRKTTTKTKKPAPANAGKTAARATPATKAKAKAKRKVAAIPKGYHSLTPYLIVRGVAAAMAFYAKAFGARETVRLSGPGDAILHAEIRIGDSMLMLGEENPDWGTKSPLTLGGNAAHLMIYTRDADAFVAKAVAAGCSVEMPVTPMFWGDRYGKIRDPFGHQWSIATHVEDVGPKEMARRAEAWARQMAPAGS